ncbi:MAG TPA: putative glycoside hydrolase [Solirubrobacteraceae bacterium]|jgi:hypothetical protein|nr:putative glycoside hydrolase [Solirubrobacteraceae bacterium]
MRRRRHHAIGIIAVALATACGSGLTANAAADTAGTVHFVRTADSSFNVYTASASPSTRAWLGSHMWRMIVWSPYFDEKTSWYGQGWMYRDAYAIYKGSQLATQHPEWILKDSAGNDLYIPYGCSNGSCPQYAGDISSPAFRRYWIEEAKAQLSHGYRGLFVDDVNMEERVGNGEEHQLLPIGANGQPITASAWRAYMAEFMVEVRAALPSFEIVHNAIWFANGDAGSSDPSIRREIESANYVNLERGVNDPGLTGGNGPWSLNAFLAYVDQVHALGRGTVLAGTANDQQGLEYNLASYFLTSTGNDAVSGNDQTPENWWTGWNVNLGQATGARYVWGGALRRDFAGGMVLVNPPGAATRAISLPTPMQDASGNTVGSVTLSAASGVVLTGNAPAPTQPSAEGATMIPTRTIVETSTVGSHPRPKRGSFAGGTGKKHSQGRTGSPARRRHTSRHLHPGPRTHQASRRGHRPAPLRAVLTRIRGLVNHATEGTVAIQIDRRHGSRWIAVRRLTAAVGASGRFVSLVNLRAASRYRVCAVYLGAAGYQPSRSGYRVIVLHAR